MMTSCLKRSFSLAHLGGKPLWNIAYNIPRRYVQEFPGMRFDNSIPRDHVLLLAEKTKETPHTNELLRIPRGGEPDVDFSKLNVERCFKGLSHVICQFDNYITDIDNQPEINFESIKDIFKDIEKHLVPLDYAYNLLRLMIAIDKAKFQYKEIAQLLEQYKTSNERRMEGSLKERLENKSWEDRRKLSYTDRTLLKIYGISVQRRSNLRPLDESSLFHLRENLNQEKKVFVYQVNLSNEKFSHTVDDPDILAAVSAEFDNGHELHHKDRTPLVIKPHTYHKFMRLCPDRFVRHSLFKAYNKRCSPKDIPKRNNWNLLNNIRVTRRKIADMTGYRTHLDYRLEDTMAGSKQRVLDSLGAINSEVQSKLVERIQELYEFASDNSFAEVSRQGLEEYDIDYWLNRYMQEILIGMSDLNLKSFFPFENVMQGIRNYFSEYFSLEMNIENIVGDNFRPDSTLIIKLSRHGDPLGSIIYDPYIRASKTLTNMFYARIRSRVRNSTHLPARFISSSFIANPDTGIANLSVLDVMNLFYCFSTVIQRLLYNFEYYELNTYGGLQPDVKNLLPNLCLGHMLCDHKIIQSCSNRDGFKPIDSELAGKITRAYIYARPFKTWFELYKSHLDIDLNATLTDTKNLVMEIYPRYSPFTRDPDNYDYCAMNDIFVGPEDGLYYGDLWSKQVANFCLRQLMNEDGRLDESRTKELFPKLTESLFDPDHHDTDKKLVTLFGKSFEPSKAGLGML